jgi:hypothetical protein
MDATFSGSGSPPIEDVPPTPALAPDATEAKLRERETATELPPAWPPKKRWYVTCTAQVGMSTTRMGVLKGGGTWK